MGCEVAETPAMTTAHWQKFNQQPQHHYAMPKPTACPSLPPAHPNPRFLPYSASQQVASAGTPRIGLGMNMAGYGSESGASMGVGNNSGVGTARTGGSMWNALGKPKAQASAAGINGMGNANGSRSCGRAVMSDVSNLLVTREREEAEANAQRLLMAFGLAKSTMGCTGSTMASPWMMRGEMGRSGGGQEGSDDAVRRSGYGIGFGYGGGDEVEGQDGSEFVGEQRLLFR